MTEKKIDLQDFLQNGSSFEKREIVPNASLERIPPNQDKFKPRLGLVFTRIFESKEADSKEKKGKKKMPTRLLSITSKDQYDYFKQLFNDPQVESYVLEMDQINQQVKIENEAIFQQKKASREAKKTKKKETELGKSN